jgi:hypothetical protein
VLAEKMLQFKLPAAHSIRIPAGEAQGLTLLWKQLGREQDHNANQ